MRWFFSNGYWGRHIVGGVSLIKNDIGSYISLIMIIMGFVFMLVFRVGKK